MAPVREKSGQERKKTGREQIRLLPQPAAFPATESGVRVRVRVVRVVSIIYIYICSLVRRGTYYIYIIRKALTTLTLTATVIRRLFRIPVALFFLYLPDHQIPSLPDTDICSSFSAQETLLFGAEFPA
jgi:hypothetical protein